MNFLARSNKLVFGKSDKISGVEEAGKSAKKNMSRTLPTAHGVRKKMIFVIIIIIIIVVNVQVRMR